MMQRVTRSTAVAVRPPPPASPGTPGYFTGGDPVAGLPPTVPGNEWFNGVQETLAHPIELVGMTLDEDDDAQLTDAILILIGKDAAVYGAPGTYSFTVPDGIYRIHVRVWGGGGGGGGVGGGGGGAAGGAGGGYSEGWFAVTPGQVLVVTVGAGGAFGNGVPSAGTAGGTSSVGALLSATGGAGGASASGGGIAPVTGGAGTGTGGALNIGGSPANAGLALGTDRLGSGGGGAYSTSLVGGVSNGTGNSPGYPGGGGGGAGGSVPADGAPGAAGLVIIGW